MKRGTHIGLFLSLLLLAGIGIIVFNPFATSADKISSGTEGDRQTPSEGALLRTEDTALDTTLPGLDRGTGGDKRQEALENPQACPTAQRVVDTLPFSPSIVFPSQGTGTLLHFEWRFSFADNAYLGKILWDGKSTDSYQLLVLEEITWEADSEPSDRDYVTEHSQQGLSQNESFEALQDFIKEAENRHNQRALMGARHLLVTPALLHNLKADKQLLSEQPIMEFQGAQLVRYAHGSLGLSCQREQETLASLEDTTTHTLNSEVPSLGLVCSCGNR